MSALSEAIRRARPQRELTEPSPFGGLNRRQTTTIDVVAQSVAAIAPAGVVLVHPAAIYARGGSTAFLDLALTVALVAMVAAVVGLFARRVSSTGSLYTFTARGLGPAGGVLAGSALAVGYLSVALSTLISGSVRLARATTGMPVPPAAVTAAIAALAGIVTALVLARGLRLSTRLLLALESVAVVFVLVLAVHALMVSEWDLSLLVPRPEHIEPEAIVAGVSFAFVGFVGFESGSALGPESRRPFASVPRGVLISVGAVALVLLVGTAAQLSLVAGLSGTATLGAAAGAESLVDAIVGVSFLACALAMTNAATRMVFALAREGLVPTSFGRTTRRGVPAFAGIVLTAVVAGVAVIAVAAGVRRETLGAITAPAATLGFLLAYTLMCIAAIAFLSRLRELTRGTALLAASAALALASLLATYLVTQTPSNPLGVLIAAGAVATLGAAISIRIIRRPGLTRSIGVHDWPEADQAIEGAPDAANS